MCYLPMVTGAPEMGQHPRRGGVDLAPNLILGSIHIRHMTGCCNGLSKLVHSPPNLPTHQQEMSSLSEQWRGFGEGGGGGGGGGGGRGVGGKVADF